MSTYQKLLAGMVAGGTACTATYPLEALRHVLYRQHRAAFCATHLALRGFCWRARRPWLPKAAAKRRPRLTAAAPHPLPRAYCWAYCRTQVSVAQGRAAGGYLAALRGTWAGGGSGAAVWPAPWQPRSQPVA